jgi:Na+-translocating ferredoxin:NAD+ oxidoreductase RnfD subunit
MTAAPPITALPAPAPHAHSGWTVARFVDAHFRGAVFPLAGGVMFFGWRALLTAVVVCASAAVAFALWRRIGRRGSQLRLAHTLWLAFLLSLMLPPHLAGFSRSEGGTAPFPLLPAAGLTLVMFLWLLGGVNAGPVHPLLITYLVLVAGFYNTLVPHRVLERQRAAVGDVLDTPPAPGRPPPKEPWGSRAREPGGRDAVWIEPASQRLTFYTAGEERPDREVLLLLGLLRDRMPPLEDLLVGGHPAPIGLGSIALVLVGGLYLLYRDVIDYRIPLIASLVAFALLLMLPIPAAITERGPQWSWLAVRDPRVGWATAVTFANYELAAGPALLVFFYLATLPSMRPMTGRGRLAFAVVLGALTAVAQLYASVPYGPYIALLLTGLLTPLWDRMFKPRPLV